MLPVKPPRIAQRAKSIAISGIKEMAMRAAKIEDVASLTWGLPSFRTPDHIRQGIEQRLQSDPDIGKYALPDGLPELRAAVTDEHSRATGIALDGDRNVIITAGNMQGMNALLHTCIDPGDEVIVTDPGFSSHIQQIRLCNGVPVPWRLDEVAGWELDLEIFPDLITEKTKAIVLVTPSNPTGSIFAEDQLRRIGNIALTHGLLVLLDDPYHHFAYENRSRYFNLASLPELSGHVAYLFTFSKSHAMSGWRLGYMVVSEALKKQVLKVHDATIICAPHISQVAGLIALRDGAAHVAAFEKILSRRRDLICERLDRVPHVFDYVKPQGAYYVFPRIVAAHETSQDFAVWLLEEARVCVTPGAAFGAAGEHHVRMAFCVEDEVIDKAFDRIERHFPR
ncbi:MAG TPA: pyridoxal phosphate-dependent aminotransferase [Afifellaceae bacterium]|nr:pyridoxal phosphate-dependent aminotransferase [Afifellaceae bacterium]